jgi:hypothetical protein
MGTLGEQFVNSFWAYDEDGNAYKINVFRSIIDIGDFQDPNGTRLGMPRLRTEEGLAVNVIDKEKGEFLIVQTNTSIHIK